MILFLKDSLMLILPSKNFLGFVCLGEKGEEGDFGGINFPPRLTNLFLSKLGGKMEGKPD